MDPVNSPAKKKQKEGKSEISSLENSIVAPHSACTEMQEEAPAWFRAYEARLIARFEQLSEHCTSTHGLLQHNIDEVSDKVNQLQIALSKAEDKIDDLENRSRRNNIVIIII